LWIWTHTENVFENLILLLFIFSMNFGAMYLFCPLWYFMEDFFCDHSQ